MEKVIYENKKTRTKICIEDKVLKLKGNFDFDINNPDIFKNLKCKGIRILTLKGSIEEIEINIHSLSKMCKESIFNMLSKFRLHCNPNNEKITWYCNNSEILKTGQEAQKMLIHNFKLKK